MKAWKTQDFDGVLFVGLEGYRDFENGRAGFTAGSCVRCHQFAGVGPDNGVDLAGIPDRYSPRDLLEKILSPAHPADRDKAEQSFGYREISMGYVDHLEEEDILDLLAFLLSGGDAKDAMFAK